MDVLIVDDEEPAREEMRWLLGQCTGVDVVGAARNFDEARGYFSGEERGDGSEPDLVLLDIDMPGVDGVRVAEWLEGTDALVVFVTAYEDYAVDAFGLDAVDYLLKPVRLERLQEALERVRRRRREVSNVDREQSASVGEMGDMGQQNDGEAGEPALRRLSVRPIGSKEGEEAAQEAFRVIDLEDVEFIEADAGNVMVRVDGRRYRADFRLKDLEERLDDEDFFRCHRSYVVRMSAIEAIEPEGDGRYRLVIDTEEGRYVPLARSRAAELKRRMPWSTNLLDKE